MKTLAEKLKQNSYQAIAEKFNTHHEYVGQIARGERKGLRGKGLLIKKELQRLARKK